MSKVRSDAKLKGLPRARQERIVEWAATPKSKDCVGGIAYARAQLAAEGLRVSARAVSEFLSWWDLRERFSSASSRAAQIAEMAAQQSPDMSPERVRELAQAVFTLEAVEGRDAKGFVGLERLVLARESAETKAGLERERLALDREKFEVEMCKKFVAWFADAKAREIAESGLSNADKIAALRAEYFRDVDALEKSGGVTLPE